MAETSRAADSYGILDWLESVQTEANAQLFLDNFGGSASSPRLSQHFSNSPSPFSHDRSPFIDSAQDTRMYSLPYGDLDSSQVIERNDGETPISNRSLRAFSTESLPNQLPRRPEKLRFLRLDEWDEGNSYTEEVPTYLHYSLEWTVSVNNKKISKNTEQDQVLQLSENWHIVLKPKLDKLLQRKVAQNRHVRCEDTTIVASVNHRSEPDVTKQFENLNIDWPLIEKQMIEWGDLFRSGKKLRINVAFNYMDSQPPVGTKGVTKRGSCATQRMLADRTSQLAAEEDSEGQPSIWQNVYALMRCPGPPCDLGPHCWIEPVGKKHYKLRTHHLRSLIEHVQSGEPLRNHDDVPDRIREQLVAEERQWLERRPKAAANAASPFPPINITNVLPSSHPPASRPTSDASSVGSSDGSATRFPRITSLEIPGPRDAAVRRYSEWQQSNVIDEEQKRQYTEAGRIILHDGLDLEQVSEGQEVDLLIRKGIKRGVAWRYAGVG